MSPAAVAIQTLRHPVRTLHLGDLIRHRPPAPSVIFLPEAIPEIKQEEGALSPHQISLLLGSTPLTASEKEIAIANVASLNKITRSRAAHLVEQASRH